LTSAFRQMMRDDREGLGLSVARAPGLIGVSLREYRETRGRRGLSRLQDERPDLRIVRSGRIAARIGVGGAAQVEAAKRPPVRPHLTSIRAWRQRSGL